MDAQQFLAEFGYIANAPGGITRLRELILELAIHGELLDSSDQPGDAAMLLSEIERHKAALIREGKLKRITPLPIISTSELSFQLPTNWRFERLGNVCEIVRGVTFPASKKQTVPSDTSVICLRTSNVQAEVDWNDLIYIDEELVGREDQWVEEGDTLISMANSYELVGKVALVRNLYARATFGGFLAAIRPHLLDPEYLYLVLRSPYMQSRMRSTASQTTNIANISLGGMRPIPTPIPPKEEQSRIVAKVDELMALCDKLEVQQQDRRKLQNALRLSTLQAVAAATSPHELKTTWTRLADNFGQLFYAPEDVLELRSLILDLAVHGLIIEQDNSDEPISSWLAGVAAQKGEMVMLKKISKQTALADISENDYPFALPKGWSFVHLAAITNKIGSGSTPRGGRDVYVKEGIPFLRSQNVWNNGLQLDDVACITSDEHVRMAGTAVQANDILLNITGASLGRCALVPTDFGDANVSQHVTIIRPTDPQVRDYLHLCILSPYTQSMIWGRQVGMAREGLSKKVLEQFEIPLPPIPEQHRIVARVAELMRFCDKLETQLRTSIDLASRVAASAVSSITGITTEKEEEEPLKAPQTELIAPLHLGQTPDVKAQAPLATILARHKGEMSAKDLWQRFGGEIDAFYAQLKNEVAHGWILKPDVAEMREKESI
jgi:type I restriction enzyme S subunit